mmetsp:Transcript_33790/g.74121  ORF Transcript_33790/g.74121 Transcript_33790/m.74121 type:complete len:195 (+) Transcript_33790:175-759(+)
MPATAGRVRMPANNRMQTSASLNTHGIWQNAIGYDPYAGEKDAAKATAGASSEATADGQNMYENMKGLLALARMTHGKVHGEDERGGWKGKGKLRGGIIKDYGEVPKEELYSGDMPSSTTSESDDSDDEPTRAVAVPAEADRKRKREHKSEKKSKKEKKHKKEKKLKREKKSKKEKRDKSDKAEKRRRRRSDSD